MAEVWNERTDSEDRWCTTRRPTRPRPSWLWTTRTPLRSAQLSSSARTFAHRCVSTQSKNPRKTTKIRSWLRNCFAEWYQKKIPSAGGLGDLEPNGHHQGLHVLLHGGRPAQGRVLRARSGRSGLAGLSFGRSRTDEQPNSECCRNKRFPFVSFESVPSFLPFYAVRPTGWTLRRSEVKTQSDTAV